MSNLYKYMFFPILYVLNKKMWRLLGSKEYSKFSGVYPWLKLKNKANGVEVRWLGRKLTVSLPLEPKLLSTYHSINKTCCLVLSGPSANEINFNQIMEEVDFISVNGSFHALTHDCHIKYYCVVDPDFLKGRFTDFLVAFKACDNFVTTSRCLCYLFRKLDPSFIKRKRLLIIDRHNNNYFNEVRSENELDKFLSKHPSQYLPDDGKTKGGEIGFSEDLSLGCFGGCTVAATALQLAYNLGYQRVFIAGLDLSNTNKRCYSEGDDVQPSLLDENYFSVILPFFKLVRSFVDRSNFKIYNLSMKSRLPNEILEKYDWNLLR